MRGKDDSAREEKAAIAAAIYCIFAICNKSADGGGDAEVEEHQVTCDLLGQGPKTKLLLAQIVKGEGDAGRGIGNVDGDGYIASTKATEEVTSSGGHE